VYSSSQGCHTATGTHMPHGITQCYLPPDRGDIPALTPAEADTGLSSFCRGTKRAGGRELEWAGRPAGSSGC